MGSCFSSYQERGDYNGETANVISIDGELHEYNVSVTAGEVLQSQNFPLSSYFVCNSDKLLYDEYIPALHPQETLVQNQIYFILPKSKLQQRLSASDMAAMAVKASLAMQKADKKKRRNRKKKKKGQIAPFLVLDQRVGTENRGFDFSGAKKYDGFTAVKRFDDEKTVNAKASFLRSGSARKIQKYSSRRMKWVARSFRMRLSTIDEGSVVP